MAISRGGYRLLLEECYRKPFFGDLLQLGRNTIYLTMEEILRWSYCHNVKLNQTVSKLSNLPECAFAGCVDDNTLFSSLGFATVDSCDISDSEKPTFVIDLNKPIPQDMHNRYDVIIDSGTVEHIFDLKTVLANIHNALKVGGRAIFMTVPSSNYVDHGYYMFSPQLFFDYFCMNRYSIISSYIILFKKDFLRDPWSIYKYLPGVLDNLNYGCMPHDMMVSFWISVEKKVDSCCDIIPQQGCSRAYFDKSLVSKTPEFLCQL